MKVLEATRDKVVVELSGQEFTDIVSAVSSVREEYAVLDQAMLDVPEERIVALDDRLSDALEGTNRWADFDRDR
jgi:hypothetical protein